MAKDCASTYDNRGRPTASWLKVKVRRDGLFVSGGIVQVGDSFGGLLVGEWEGEHLVYCARAEVVELLRQCQPLVRFANNPTPYALDALPRWARQEKALVLSLGTGSPETPIKFDDAWRWGELRWLNPLLDIMFSDPGAESETARMLRRERHDYFRLQPRLPSGITLDDTRRILDLKKVGN